MEVKRVWGLGAYLFVLVVAAYLLITASPLLTLSLDAAGTLPLGTFITWFGLIAFPSFLLFVTGELFAPTTKWARVFSKILKGIIFLAFAWGPFCALLAGNWSYTFAEKSTFQGGQIAMTIFWYFNYFLVLAPVFVTLVYKIIALVINLKRTQ